MEEKNQFKGKRKKAKKKKSKLKIVLLSILVLIVFIASLGGGYLFSQLNKIKSTNISKNAKDLGINQNLENQLQQNGDEGKIINIALFGVDSRVKGSDAGNSDAIMIATIDLKHKDLKLSSVMRDSYVHVDGLGMTKINAAYAYGGPQLAIKTLNQNFNLDIKDYATVDFFSLEKIIDALGGVEINVQPAEIQYINSYMKEVSQIEGTSIPTVTHSGLQKLNGKQAVAYSRIRYVGNNDFERTDRQRTVLNQLFQTVKKDGITSYPNIISQILPYTETSMSKLDIISLGTQVLTSGATTLNQERFPVDGYWQNATINGIYYLKIDQASTTDQIDKFIYDDVKPTSK